MKVEVNKLKHHPFNAEVYKLSDIDSLKESILNVGLLEPLVINKKNEVISGNRRLEALKELTMEKKIPYSFGFPTTTEKIDSRAKM